MATSAAIQASDPSGTSRDVHTGRPTCEPLGALASRSQYAETTSPSTATRRERCALAKRTAHWRAVGRRGPRRIVARIKPWQLRERSARLSYAADSLTKRSSGCVATGGRVARIGRTCSRGRAGEGEEQLVAAPEAGAQRPDASCCGMSTSSERKRVGRTDERRPLPDDVRAGRGG